MFCPPWYEALFLESRTLSTLKRFGFVLSNWCKPGARLPDISLEMIGFDLALTRFKAAALFGRNKASLGTKKDGMRNERADFALTDSK